MDRIIQIASSVYLALFLIFGGINLFYSLFSLAGSTWHKPSKKILLEYILIPVINVIPLFILFSFDGYKPLYLIYLATTLILFALSYLIVKFESSEKPLSILFTITYLIATSVLAFNIPFFSDISLGGLYLFVSSLAIGSSLMLLIKSEVDIEYFNNTENFLGAIIALKLYFIIIIEIISSYSTNISYNFLHVFSNGQFPFWIIIIFVVMATLFSYKSNNTIYLKIVSFFVYLSFVIEFLNNKY